jgi:hypothetical protein
VVVLGALVACGCGKVMDSSRDAGQDGAAQAGAGGAGGGVSGGASGSYGGAPGGAAGTIGVGSDCRADGDCASAGALCLAPGESPGCGVCRQPTSPCNADADCVSKGTAYICEVAACSCSGAKSCIQGCVDATSCGNGQFCASDHRCASSPCQPNANDRTCLPNFMCDGTGHCARKACTADADCAGACVKGMCYPRPGTCTPPAA